MKQKRIRARETNALQERVKELTCLLRFAEIAGKPGITLGEVLDQTVGLLVAAWQYPDIASAQIVLDACAHAAPGFRETTSSQRAEIMVHGTHRGFVEVVYLQERPERDEGPFLWEERNLINAIAQQVALVVQRKQSELDRSRLEDQLRHADRLAKIGVLAAGVAHELNEPLGNILGFAQLAKKCPGLPKAAARDLSKIESASLHAREIIRNLLVFARQMPPTKTQVSINQAVHEALSLLEARFAAAGVDVECHLEPALPEIPADYSQIHQVLVNLLVNALQAMPDGGTLRVNTVAREHSVMLRVEDTGTGMGADVLQQVFVPFFTTKDVGEGNGLGLPVVHGIVTSHEGAIQIDSEKGAGTRIEIHLPMAARNDRESQNI